MGTFLGPPKHGSPPSPFRTAPTSRAASRNSSALGTVSGSPTGSLRSAMDSSRCRRTTAGDSSTMWCRVRQCLATQRAEGQLVRVLRTERHRIGENLRLRTGAVPARRPGWSRGRPTGTPRPARSGGVDEPPRPRAPRAVAAAGLLRPAPRAAPPAATRSAKRTALRSGTSRLHPEGPWRFQRSASPRPADTHRSGIGRRP